MARTPEKKVKDEVTKILKQHGAYYFYAATHGYGASGVPDIVACFHGMFIGIEVKAGRNKPTALQRLNLNQISAAGGIDLVISDTEIPEWGIFTPAHVEKVLSYITATRRETCKDIFE